MTAVVERPQVLIQAQPGPQELFLSTPADIGIMGGSVYGGKTWSLVMEPLRHCERPGFNFVAFRREMPDITNPGGMWDESKKWYYSSGGSPREHIHEWSWPSGAWGKFAGLQYESDLESTWLGSQICLLLFDQVETFTEKMFWFMFARNRSLCGVTPYTRATANPNPDSFLATLLAWWIDQETGYSIPERSGTIRWFVRLDGDTVWSTVTCRPEDYPRYDEIKAQAQAELAQRFPLDAPFLISITYVLARLQDNKIGQEIDPSYEAKVRALPKVERERLLGGDKGGNWKIKATAGDIFNRSWFTIVGAAPSDTRWVRYWDKAGTEAGGCYTVGVKMGYSDLAKKWYVGHVAREQLSHLGRERMIKATAQMDGTLVDVYTEQEPGSGGKESAQNTVLNLAGFAVHIDRVSGDKYTRAKPFCSQCEALNVVLIEGDWNQAYIDELHNFNPDKGGLKDQVDASSGAFNKLSGPTLEVLGGKPVTPEQQAAQEAKDKAEKDAQADAFRKQVEAVGCYFPGE